jgi:hypothetical protein
MANYFNTLPLREQLEQLSHAEFMDNTEFTDGVNALKGKKNRNRRMWCARLEPRFKLKR